MNLNPMPYFKELIQLASKFLPKWLIGSVIALALVLMLIRYASDIPTDNQFIDLLPSISIVLFLILAISAILYPKVRKFASIAALIVFFLIALFFIGDKLGLINQSPPTLPISQKDTTVVVDTIKVTTYDTIPVPPETKPIHTPTSRPDAGTTANPISINVKVPSINFMTQHAKGNDFLINEQPVNASSLFVEHIPGNGINSYDQFHFLVKRDSSYTFSIKGMSCNKTYRADIKNEEVFFPKCI